MMDEMNIIGSKGEIFHRDRILYSLVAMATTFDNTKMPYSHLGFLNNNQEVILRLPKLFKWPL